MGTIKFLIAFLALAESKHCTGISEDVLYIGTCILLSGWIVHSSHTTTGKKE